MANRRLDKIARSLEARTHTCRAATLTTSGADHRAKEFANALFELFGLVGVLLASGIEDGEKSEEQGDKIGVRDQPTFVIFMLLMMRMAAATGGGHGYDAWGW